MILSAASRFTIRNIRSSAAVRRSFSGATINNSRQVAAGSSPFWMAGTATALVITSVAIACQGDNGFRKTLLAAPVPISGDILMLEPTKESSTGIMFPALCNGLALVGCGVRVKWGLIKVYAVGTYMDTLAMSAVKSMSKEQIEKALLDPMYPRTIRIVMARNLSVDKFTSAIVEALEPRMNGQDLDKLDEFKKLNPPVDLIEGAEMEMTIRGDTLLYKNSTGGVGQIKSAVFCGAMCDVYYGKDAVSPTHKESVLAGIPKMK